MAGQGDGDQAQRSDLSALKEGRYQPVDASSIYSKPVILSPILMRSAVSGLTIKSIPILNTPSNYTPEKGQLIT
jgi:hypothetical protein